MEKYRLKTGWTKEKALAVLFKGNDGSKAADCYGDCLYLSETGNKCAVGCFIPDGHPAQSLRGGFTALRDQYPELLGIMPLDDEGMLTLQRAHDKLGVEEHFFTEHPELKGAANEHEIFEQFFENYVDDGVPQ